jgi:hypothetical protein
VRPVAALTFVTHTHHSSNVPSGSASHRLPSCNSMPNNAGVAILEADSYRWAKAHMRLFHFSDDPSITLFEPRPVRVPSDRGQGRDWLNGPLVWAIDEAFAPMYLFPRDCPRIVLLRKPDTTPTDLARWFGPSNAKVLAHIESAWLESVSRSVLYRYELPSDDFEALHDAGMWVSREPVRPMRVDKLSDLPAALRAAEVELRVMDDLTPLRSVWGSTLHASGIRLRNAKGWVSQRSE